MQSILGIINTFKLKTRKFNFSELTIYVVVITVAATTLDRLVAFYFCQITKRNYPLWAQFAFSTPLVLMTVVWSSCLVPIFLTCVLKYDKIVNSRSWLIKQKKLKKRNESAKKKLNISNSSLDDLESSGDCTFTSNPNHFPFRNLKEKLFSSFFQESSLLHTHLDDEQGNNTFKSNL